MSTHCFNKTYGDVMKNLIISNVTGSTDVANFERWMSMSTQSIDFEHFYYAHSDYKTSDYDRCIAFVDTGWLPSQELEESIIRKCSVLKDRGFTIVLGNLWESTNQIKQTAHANFLSDFDYKIWDGGKTFFWYLMHNRYCDQEFHFDHSTKKFDFLYLNKMQRPHRELLFDSMKQSNLLDNSLVSYWQRNIHLASEYELPWLNGELYPMYGRDRDIFEKPYNESVFNLVSETSDTEIFFTEKIWKPIVAGQPFILHGARHYLKNLRDMGFMTFGDHFDETYDREASNHKRISNIVALCNELVKIDPSEFYDATRSIRKHNTKHFFDPSSLKNAVDQEVLGLLELVDSR